MFYFSVLNIFWFDVSQIVAICAFATAVSNHSETGFQVTKCNNTETNVKRTMEFYYPYKWV